VRQPVRISVAYSRDRSNPPISRFVLTNPSEEERSVQYILAFLIFAVLATVSWFVAVACFRSTFAAPDPSECPNYSLVRGVAIGVVTMMYFIPFPVGYYFSLVAWFSAVFGFLEMQALPGLVLFIYLAFASIVSRVAVLGVLNMV
jgi:hypothetical protein